MKRVVFIFVMILFITGYTFAQEQKASGKTVAEGITDTPFGGYRVEIFSEPIIIEGQEVTCYMIKYDKSPVTIKVLVDKEKRCKNYIVISNGLSVMYKCNGQYFGVNRIDEKYSKDGFVTDDTNLDKEEYFHQKLLVHGQQEEVFAASLIACYFPELIKE